MVACKDEDEAVKVYSWLDKAIGELGYRNNKPHIFTATRYVEQGQFLEILRKF